MLRRQAGAHALVPPADPVGLTPVIDLEDAVPLLHHALRSRTNTGTSGTRRLVLLGGLQQSCSGPSDYYCAFAHALNRTATLVPDDGKTTVVLPWTCSWQENGNSLRRCLAKLSSTSSPAVLMLHKLHVGGQYKKKMELVRSHRCRLEAVYTPDDPDASTGVLERDTGVPWHYLGYASSFGDRTWRRALERASQIAAATHEPAYVHDVGFSGGWQRFSGRYAFRAELFVRGGVVSRLRAEKWLRFYLPSNKLPDDKYALALYTTKIWLSTTEGDSAGPRYLDIMSSGRAMLLCNRHPKAYAPLGIVEGEHAAMFNSSAEFEAKLRHYLAHEAERLELVRAAKRLANERHTWDHRAQQLVRSLPADGCKAAPLRPRCRLCARKSTARGVEQCAEWSGTPRAAVDSVVAPAIPSPAWSSL